MQKEFQRDSKTTTLFRIVVYVILSYFIIKESGFVTCFLFGILFLENTLNAKFIKEQINVNNLIHDNLEGLLKFQNEYIIPRLKNETVKTKRYSKIKSMDS